MSVTMGLDLDVVIVGAGFSGLYALQKLRSLGFRVHVFEAAEDVGGTWYWNRYPGARCDVESMEYSYSFSEELQQEWEWPERYSAQPHILSYIQHVADRFHLKRSITFGTRVTRATFDAEGARWTLETDKGDVITALFCVMASGFLSQPNLPDIPGMSNFKGRILHTGLWPHEPPDFAGEAVGVVGTGASGIQIIPLIAAEASHLHVFQRTANYTVPAYNHVLEPGAVALHKARYAEYREEARNTPFGMAGIPVPLSRALEDSHDVRVAKYEERWLDGNVAGFLSAYSDLLLDKEANETAAEFVRSKIRAVVKDPQTVELLTPVGYHIGTKRLPMDTGYFETFNRENVELVDIKRNPIERFTSTGLKTSCGDYRLDTVIFATGFDALTGALLNIDISGKAGLALRAKWEAGPRSLLGLMTEGFPNLFIIAGPGTPAGKTNTLPVIELQVDWVVNCLSHMRNNRLQAIEARADSEENWVRHVDEVANASLYPTTKSWYVGANIPGKPQGFMVYVGGLDRYGRMCAEVAANGYEGFDLR